MTAPGPGAGYPMRRWVFQDARGRYDIDLGDSNVDCGTVADLPFPADLVLDYGTDRGSDRLRELVAGLYSRTPDEVGITHGAQEALYLLYSVLLRPGDHVVVFAPGWQQAWEAPARMGSRADLIGTTPEGRPDVALAARLIGPSTKAVVLNSPCNPTGIRFTDYEVDFLVRAARRHGCYLLLDEEYVADLPADSLLRRYERAVSVSSISKVYGFPGLRTGWMCGPADVVRAAMDHKHYTTISNSVLTEWLAAQVLERRDHYLDRYRRLTSVGGQMLSDWAARHADAVALRTPHGTPFAWLALSGAESSLSLCRRVLDQTRVLLMPAEVFGAERGLRITFAREEDVLKEGLARIGTLLDSGHPRAEPEPPHA
ncbi:aminotransferase class I/II-fold pyridoxal phosphate-dependent enzyme [Streptomyces sp. G-G2]|uniref:aminotransferase class I/II-fold pyridoxal phosphate-dependent enzyme n=1 Tax=Streptomyces sp. G-G2 TaxID=3046201 RepID=UPI0024BA6879|nr:aminotransferase class I/II-fold pyridoxal phosphate-dependent enzyme [Streptomyces sp. G-G2]MDJ0380135.1 aminotransferase class I/II-fold pyridoxal phosphate-dependent enzyme [Streptomyces sp. G-G2]